MAESQHSGCDNQCCCFPSSSQCCSGGRKMAAAVLLLLLLYKDISWKPGGSCGAAPPSSLRRYQPLCFLFCFFFLLYSVLFLPSLSPLFSCLLSSKKTPFVSLFWFFFPLVNFYCFGPFPSLFFSLENPCCFPPSVPFPLTKTVVSLFRSLPSLSKNCRSLSLGLPSFSPLLFFLPFGTVFIGVRGGVDPAPSHRCPCMGRTCLLLCHGVGKGGQWRRCLQGTTSLSSHHKAGGVWFWL